MIAGNGFEYAICRRTNPALTTFIDINPDHDAIGEISTRLGLEEPLTIKLHKMCEGWWLYGTVGHLVNEWKMAHAMRITSMFKDHATFNQAMLNIAEAHPHTKQMVIHIFCEMGFKQWAILQSTTKRLSGEDDGDLGSPHTELIYLQAVFYGIIYMLEFHKTAPELVTAIKHQMMDMFNAHFIEWRN